MKDIQTQLAFIRKLEKLTGLVYVPEIPAVGRVCFAESEGLRPEFKTMFTAQNLNDYLLALENSDGRFEANLLGTNIDSLRFPKNAAVFWEMVDEGNKLRGKR